MSVAAVKMTDEEWQAKMAVRMDASIFDGQRLVNLLLTEHWKHECQIIPDFMPNFPREDTKPACVVRHFNPQTENHRFLRYSKGPLQGYFWDIYGEDFHSPELALIALANAPAPPNVSVLPTHGK